MKEATKYNISLFTFNHWNCMKCRKAIFYTQQHLQTFKGTFKLIKFLAVVENYCYHHQLFWWGKETYYKVECTCKWAIPKTSINSRNKGSEGILQIQNMHLNLFSTITLFRCKITFIKYVDHQNLQNYKG